MIVEEKKAGEHICPHLTEWRQKCEALRCMAWRWADIRNPDWRPPNLMYQPDPLGNSLTIKSDTEGYCGLAGRP